MIYIPVTNEQTAAIVSEKIYNLTRPTAVKDPNDTTQYYCNWVIHPTTNEVMLEMPEVADIPVHIAAKEDELDDIFQPFVLAEFISVEEVQAIKTAIQENKGNAVNINQFIPGFWINQVKTKEELEKDGWFNAPG